jgi:glutathione S-transferase
MITIYNFARGVRGLRVAWQCEEMGLPYNVELLSYPTSDAYRALHPLGSVPFLQDDGGVAISESVAIMLYLAHRYGPTPLLPEQHDPRLARVLQLTVFGEATLGACINPLLGAHFVAPEGDKNNWTVRGLRARGEQSIGFVADMLGKYPFLAGSELSLADISISCALGMWKGGLDLPLPDKLTAWRERLAARPAYQRAVARMGGAEQAPI